MREEEGGRRRERGRKEGGREREGGGGKKDVESCRVSTRHDHTSLYLPLLAARFLKLNDNNNINQYTYFLSLNAHVA